MFFKDKIIVNQETHKATIMRDGSYVYLAGEIGLTDRPSDEAVIVFRPAEEVIKAYQRFKDLQRLPITSNHPNTFLDLANPNTYKDGEGFNPEYTKKGVHAVVDCELTLTGQTKADYDSGTKELSCGWMGDFEPTNNSAYMFIQRFTDINHIAMVDRGRCGSLCSVTDATPEQISEGKQEESEHTESFQKLFNLVKGGISLEEFVEKAKEFISSDHLDKNDKYYIMLKEMEQKLNMKDGGTYMGKKITDEEMKKEEEKKEEKKDEAFEGKETPEEEKQEEQEKKEEAKDEEVKPEYTKEHLKDLLKHVGFDEEKAIEHVDCYLKEKSTKDESEVGEEKKEEKKETKDAKPVIDKAMIDKAIEDTKKMVIGKFSDVLPLIKSDVFKVKDLQGKSPCEIKAMFVKKYTGKEIKIDDAGLDTAFEVAKKVHVDSGWAGQITKEENNVATVVDNIKFKAEGK